MRLVYGERGEVSWEPSDCGSMAASEFLIARECVRPAPALGVNSTEGTRRKAGELGFLRQPHRKPALAQDEDRPPISWDPIKVT